jgi:hypothetical protein
MDHSARATQLVNGLISRSLENSVILKHRDLLDNAHLELHALVFLIPRHLTDLFRFLTSFIAFFVTLARLSSGFDYVAASIHQNVGDQLFLLFFESFNAEVVVGSSWNVLLLELSEVFFKQLD